MVWEKELFMIINRTVLIGGGLLMAVSAPLATAATSSSAKTLAAEPATNPWSGSKASFGFNLSTGNTKSMTTNGELDVDYTRGLWTANNQISFQYGKNDGVENKKQYSFLDQLSYSLNHNADIDNYVFAQSSYQSSAYAAFKSQFVFTMGYGRDWIKTKKFQLSTQLGPAYRLSVAQDPDATRTSSIGGKFSAIFKWNNVLNGAFEQDLNYTMGKPANTLSTVTSYSTKLIKHLALSFSFTTNYVSTVPIAGKKKFDTNTSINLVYSV
jgi:putative salt-induced outer membrane protein